MPLDDIKNILGQGPRPTGIEPVFAPQPPDPDRAPGTYSEAASFLSWPAKMATPWGQAELSRVTTNKLLGLSNPEPEVLKTLDANHLSAVGFGLFWLNRGYAGVMSAADALTSPNPNMHVVPEAWKGFTGQRNGSMINLLENAGFDKSKASTRAVAAGLDVFPGMFLDPLTYVAGVGAIPKIKNVAEGVKILGGIDDAARAAEVASKVKSGEWSARFAGQIQGLTKMPGRAELAKRGLWGLNVKLPYLPVVTPAIDKMTKFGSVPLTREGITITPKWLNVQAAQALNKAGEIPWLSSMYTNLRSVVGGMRWQAERSGMAGTLERSELLRQRFNEKAIDGQSNLKMMAELIPVEQRRTAAEANFHLLENPAEAMNTGTVRSARLLTPEEQARAEAANAQYLKAQSDVVEEFNRGTVAEVQGLRRSVEDMGGSRKRLVTLTTQELEHYAANTSDPYYATGDFLERFVHDLNVDPRQAESLITSYLRDHAGYPQEADPVLFKAVIGESQYNEIAGKPVKTRAGAVRARTPAEINQAMKRAAGQMPPEMAEKVGETSNARILVEVPEHSTLSPEFKNLGGTFASLDKRKERVNQILDTLEQNANRGGNNLEVVESYGKLRDMPENKGYKAAWRTAARKAGLDPDNKTVQQIVEAIYHRRIGNTHVPGWYTMNSDRLADDIMAEALFANDPAGRFWHQHETLRKSLDNVQTKLSMAQQGHIPAAELVPPDYLTPEQLDDMGKQMSVRDTLVARRSAIDDEIRQLHEGFDPQQVEGVDQRIAELRKEREVIENNIWDVEGAPIKEMENRYIANLLAERDGIVEQLRNQDPFERAAYIRDKLKKQADARKRFPYVVDTMSVEGGGIDTSYFTPEMWESYYRQKAFRDSITQGIYERKFQKYDKNFNMPIEDYMPHMFSVSKAERGKLATAAAAGDKAAIKSWKNGRIAEIHSQFPTENLSTIKRQVDEEFNLLQGEQRPSVRSADVHKLPKQFMQRKYRATVLEMQRGGLPIDWEKDSIYALNAMYTKALRWDYTTSLVEHMIEEGVAVHGQDAIHTTPLMVADQMGLLAPEKNPFTNLYVAPEVRAMYDQISTGFMPRLLSDEGFKKMLNWATMFRQWWSAWTLLPFPAYHVRNVVSDVLRAQMEGLDINLVDPAVRRRVNAAMALSRPGSEKHFQRFMPGHLQNGPLPGGVEQILSELRSKYPQEARNLTKETFLRYLRAHVMDVNMRDVDHIMPELESAAKGGEKGRRWFNTNGPLLNWFARKIGNPAQNFSRIWLFLDQLEKHSQSGLMNLDDSMRAATKSVRKSLFDYGDLTPTEQNVIKNVMPFYTYTARTLPFHYGKLLTDPKVFAPYARAYIGAWNGYEGDFSPEDSSRWITDQLGVPLYSRTDPKSGGKTYYMMSPQGFIGVGDMNEVAEWIRDLATNDKEGLARMTGTVVGNPLLSSFLETTMKTDLMTGKEIDENRVVTTFGFPVDWRVAVWLRNWRLINTIDGAFPGVWRYVEKKLGVISPDRDQRAHRNDLQATELFTKYLTGARLFGADPIREYTTRAWQAKKEVKDAHIQAMRAAAQEEPMEAQKNQKRAQAAMLQLQDSLEKLRLWENKAQDAKRMKALAGFSEGKQ